MTNKPLRKISFIIPMFNEAGTLEELVRRINDNVKGLACDHEILFVDDGSTDGSFERVQEMAAADPRIKGISFAVNYGKAEALNAGFRNVTGDVVFTMDADLQDDPEEIPRFIEKLKEGYDLVSGWKQNRQDPWHKTLPSRLFNRVVSLCSGIRLHDFNCGFKAYRMSVIKRLSIYGELHRFIPVLAAQYGARIGELPVKHNPRTWGHSKYGFERFHKGFFDLITIVMTTRYLKRPLHFFGTIGLLLALVGTGALGYLSALWVLGYRPIGNRPMLMFAILFVVAGIQIFSTGLIAELFIRFNRNAEQPIIQDMLNLESQPD